MLKEIKIGDRIVLFGATLGAETDRLLNRTSLTDMAKAVVMQACAAAFLEEYCDECQMKIGEELEKIYQVRHLPSDFKKKNGYKRSTELSAEYGLYRQDYCGCEFSMAQREREKKEKEAKK